MQVSEDQSSFLPSPTQFRTVHTQTSPMAIYTSVRVSRTCCEPPLSLIPLCLKDKSNIILLQSVERVRLKAPILKPHTVTQTRVPRLLSVSILWMRILEIHRHQAPRAIVQHAMGARQTRNWFPRVSPDQHQILSPLSPAAPICARLLHRFLPAKLRSIRKVKQYLRNQKRFRSTTFMQWRRTMKKVMILIF